MPTVSVFLIIVFLNDQWFFIFQSCDASAKKIGFLSFIKAQGKMPKPVFPSDLLGFRKIRNEKTSFYNTGPLSSSVTFLSLHVAKKKR